MAHHKPARPPRSLRQMFPDLKTVIDAKRPVEVRVQAKDCAGATPLDLGHCAMARAAMRQYKVDHAVIGLGSSYLIKGTKAIRFKTPASVQREIVSFDRHKDFAPGAYSLAVVSPSLRFGAQARSGKHKAARAAHKARRRIHKTANVREFSG